MEIGVINIVFIESIGVMVRIGGVFMILDIIFLIFIIFFISISIRLGIIIMIIIY